MPEITEIRHFTPDQFGDTVPDEVYEIVSKTIIERGYGDLEVYEVFEALRKSWPPHLNRYA